MSKVKLKSSGNLISKLILVAFLILVIVAVVGKAFLVDKPSKESSFPATEFLEDELQLHGVTRTNDYLYLVFRDPKWPERDFSNIKMYPYNNEGEKGENFIQRRELRAYRIKVSKGFYSIKVDYDGQLFYFNEFDYDEIDTRDYTEEKMILEYIGFMKETYLKIIAFYNEEQELLFQEIQELNEKIVDMRSDQLFLTSSEKEKLNKDIDAQESIVLKHEGSIRLYDKAIEMYEEKIQLLEEEEVFLKTGKVTPLVVIPEGEKAEDSEIYKEDEKSSKTFRLVFSHLDENGEGVFEEFYTIDTNENYTTAKFYKTDLHGKFYVDFYDVEGDYIYLKNEKHITQDQVDDTLRVVYIDSVNGLLEISNISIMKKTNILLSCLDDKREPLREVKINFSVNENMNDSREYITNEEGLLRLENIDVSQNNLYYFSAEEAENIVEVEVPPASLINDEAVFIFPPPKENPLDEQEGLGEKDGDKENETGGE